MIKVGDTLPDARLFEFVEVASEGCAVGPNGFPVRERTAGKRVVIFGLPGAFTPTCSAKHVPGYVEAAERSDRRRHRRNLVRFRQRRVRHERVGTRSSNLGQGEDDRRRQPRVSLRHSVWIRICPSVAWESVPSATRWWSTTAWSRRCNVEAPGKFEVSDAESILATLR